MTEFLIPSTKLRKENAGRARSSPRVQRGALLGSKSDERSLRRAARCSACSEISNALT